MKTRVETLLEIITIQNACLITLLVPVGYKAGHEIGNVDEQGKIVTGALQKILELQRSLDEKAAA